MAAVGRAGWRTGGMRVEPPPTLRAPSPAAHDELKHQDGTWKRNFRKGDPCLAKWLQADGELLKTWYVAQIIRAYKNSKGVRAYVVEYDDGSLSQQQHEEVLHRMAGAKDRKPWELPDPAPRRKKKTKK